MLARLRARLWRHRVQLSRNAVPWFRLSPRVTNSFITHYDERRIPDGDIVLATAWHTVDFVLCLPDRTGRKCYFVQDYEYWVTATPEKRAKIGSTFNARLPMIAISSAVREMIRASGEREVAVIPSGIDSRVYRVRTPIDRRLRFTVGFPVRDDPTKGTADAIAAVNLLRAEWGEAMRVSAFGVAAPANLPDWVEFWEFPSDDEVASFYNKLSVFLFPSHYEGWGLPAVEALACGTALVAADSVGIRDFAINRETALVVDRGRPEQLADAVAALFRDELLRRRLAHRGNRKVQEYTWEASTATLERVLISQLA